MPMYYVKFFDLSGCADYEKIKCFPTLNDALAFYDLIKEDKNISSPIILTEVEIF